jgi:hypothetical protein
MTTTEREVSSKNHRETKILRIPLIRMLSNRSRNSCPGDGVTAVLHAVYAFQQRHGEISHKTDDAQLTPINNIGAGDKSIP